MDYNSCKLNSNMIVRNNKYDEATKGKRVLTFFTPTYNRAKFLPRIYDNLQCQTCKKFVWIIVNDGSIDNTNEICINYVNGNKLPICYIRKENGGKHSCFKLALDECKTDYFICMDDDDEYSKDAADFFLNKWDEIENENVYDSNIGAIRTWSQRKNGDYVADFAVNSEMQEFDASTLEMNYIRHQHMENWTCYKVKALSDADIFYPTEYWMQEHHRFFLEGIWQGRFARKYKCRYVFKSMRIYTDDADTSLSYHKKSRQHYWDSFLNHKILLDEQYDYISLDKILLFKMIIKVQAFRWICGISLLDLLKHCKNSKLMTLYVLTAPLSLLGIYLSKKNGL